MTNKMFKTVDEQLELLRSRGLKIKDAAKARNFLLYNNYYRISGYSLTLRKNNVFSPNASFQNIMDIYNFDHELRHIILEFIETIEVQVKSIYAYEFTKVHGATGYLNANFFTQPEKHREILNKVEKQKSIRLSHEAYLKHFIHDLQQDIPLWAYVDLLTIADISFLYAISEPQIKDAVAAAFNLTMKQGANILGSYMKSMTIIRNLCAHGGRLYNRLFEQNPSLNKKEKTLLITTPNGQIDNANFYGFILIMRRLFPQEVFENMKNFIMKLTLKYPFVRMDYYGFRNDWKQKI